MCRSHLGHRLYPGDDLPSVGYFSSKRVMAWDTIFSSWKPVLREEQKSLEYALCVCVYVCKYIHIFLTKYVLEWSLKITELVKLTLETPGPTSNLRLQGPPKFISLWIGFFCFWKLIKYPHFSLFFTFVR